MKNRAIVITLALVLVLALSTIAFAANIPVNTATNTQSQVDCEGCDGVPLQQQIRAQLQRELVIL